MKGKTSGAAEMKEAASGDHGFKRGGRAKKRADGGAVGASAGASASGGAQGLKRGGAVHGKHAKSRPDRRARGGPTSTAGKMSTLGYEKSDMGIDQGGKGKDRP